MDAPQFPHNTFHGFRRHDFRLGDNEAVVVEPRQEAPGRRWVWQVEGFGAFPAFNLAMLEKGWWIASIDVGNTFGCPDAMRRFDAFHQELTTKHGFHRRPVLAGLSRGGLFVYNWAAANPDKVGMVYADNAVCDFKSWPGGKRKEVNQDQANCWRELLKCYHFASEREAWDYQGNPVDNVAPLVKAGIPLVHSFGDADEVVPWEENTKVLAERVEALGGKIKIHRKPGCKHHPHGPADCPAFVTWVLENVLP